MALAVLLFEEGQRGGVISWMHRGKVCLVSRSYRGPAVQPGEEWICDVEKEEPRFYQVRPVVRTDKVRWGWIPDRYGGEVLGEQKKEWGLLEPAFQRLSLSLRKPPPEGNGNAAFEAALMLHTRLVKMSTAEIMAEYGQPFAVEGRCLLFKPLNGEVFRHQTNYNHLLEAGLKPTPTGALVKGTLAEFTIEGLACAKSIWLPVGNDVGPSDICPPQLRDAVRKLADCHVTPIPEILEREAHRVSEWWPVNWIRRCALWLADEDGTRSFVVRSTTKEQTQGYADMGEDRVYGSARYISTGLESVTMTRAWAYPGIRPGLPFLPKWAAVLLEQRSVEHNSNTTETIESCPAHVRAKVLEEGPKRPHDQSAWGLVRSYTTSERQEINAQMDAMWATRQAEVYAAADALASQIAEIYASEPDGDEMSCRVMELISG